MISDTLVIRFFCSREMLLVFPFLNKVEPTYKFRQIFKALNFVCLCVLYTYFVNNDSAFSMNGSDKRDMKYPPHNITRPTSDRNVL